MGKFIDDATIQAILMDKCDDVENFINCDLIISPFGKIGTKTYYSSYKNKKGEILNYKIPEELYIEYFNKINNS